MVMRAFEKIIVCGRSRIIYYVPGNPRRLLYVIDG